MGLPGSLTESAPNINYKHFERALRPELALMSDRYDATLTVQSRVLDLATVPKGTLFSHRRAH